MSDVTVVEGQTTTLVESFVDDFDDPLDLANTESGPSVNVFDDENDLINELIAVPDVNGQPGDWSVDISIPHIGLKGRKEFKARWTFKTSEGDVERVRSTIFVDPEGEERESDILVIVGRDKMMQVVLPFEYQPPVPKKEADPANGVPAVPGKEGDEVKFSLFRNNKPLFSGGYLSTEDQGKKVAVQTQSNQSIASIPAAVGKAKLEPLILLVEHSKQGEIVPTTYTYKTWAITPQVLVAASQLSDMLNKARLDNVIPELDYTQTDLVYYLARGLWMFNSFPPQTTNFDGTNMQGIILDAWLNCSAFYAFSAQLVAEGALAFDFSGQTVNLNVDRTPAIESALGRVETTINDNVKAMKKLLAKYGVLDGDGSQGGQAINGSEHLGSLSVINAPTTRLPYGGHRGSWFRPFY